MRHTAVLAASLLLLGACDDDDVEGVTRQGLHCDVAIVGGGAGGLHTAFRLAPELGEGVCLFEKEATLGGRIHDVAKDEEDPDAPVFGTGARRVMESQQVLFDLAEELDIELDVPANEADLISSRGGFAFAKDDLLPLYPQVESHEGTDAETWLYDRIRLGPERDDAADYPDFRSYIRDVAGEEEFQFLRDMSRFRADFEYPLDARGYLDYLDEEWDVCCQPSYPVGGMSSFIKGMEAKARADGARIYTEQPVTEIASGPDGGYVVVSDGYRVEADRVVIAVPPAAFPWIKGDVVERIAAQQEFKDLIGVKVVTIAQWWPERWWEDIVDPDAEADNHVWRAWTTEHCLNFIEIPLDEYGRDQKVTRTVYDDDLECVQFWEETAARGIDAVEEEIARGLDYLFNQNGVSTPMVVDIPEPEKTHVQIWPAAWHWLRAGSDYTNADIYDWAIEPLEGEEVALVGEAYNPQRSGWSDGAYKSSIHLLNARYDMDLPLPTTRRTGRRGGPRIDGR